MKMFKAAVLSTTVIALAACAATPMGPTVRAMPQQGKPFDQFAYENDMCKNYADSQVRGQAERANQTGLLGTLGGTALGAGVGAALGGGRGAAVGAGLGAAGGTVVGASSSGQEQKSIQQQYNDAYVQCMVAKGNQVQAPVVYAPQPRTVIYQQPAPPPTVIVTPAPTVVEPPPYYYVH